MMYLFKVQLVIAVVTGFAITLYEEYKFNEFARSQASQGIVKFTNDEVKDVLVPMKEYELEECIDFIKIFRKEVKKISGDDFETHVMHNTDAYEPTVKNSMTLCQLNEPLSMRISKKE